MATKQIGPIQFQGKLGTIVGRSTRKGYMSLGIKAVNVANPQTPKQVIQRVLFAGAQRFASTTPIAAFAGFTRKAKNMRCNIRNVVTSIYGKNTEYSSAAGLPTGNKYFTITGDGAVGTTAITTVVYDQLIFSDGTVGYNTSRPAKFDKPNTIELQLEDQQANVGTNNYIHHIVVFCPDTNEFIHKTFTKEEEAEASITVPDTWNGLKVHIWGYTQYPDENNTNVDYSQYGAMNSQAIRSTIDALSLFSRTAYKGSGNIG